MDGIDRRILDLIQKDFPISQRPFRAIGEQLGIGEEEVLERIRSLKERGVIRRIGATFEPKRLGYTSTLCAAKVPPEKVEEFVAVVNAYPGVTHNYERDHEYNIWFTFIGRSSEEIEERIAEIEERTGVRGIKNLPTLRRFKIDVTFHMGPKSTPCSSS